MWRDIKRIIQKHTHFLLTTHINPDGDGVGAASALTELLLRKGKHVRVVFDSPVPAKLSFLDYHGLHEIYHPNGNYDDVEVVVVLDANRLDRIGGVAAIATRPGIVTVCIDHHEGATPFTRYSAIDSRACSAGALVYGLYKELGIEMNLHAANGIYTGILCDTGRFCYSTTTLKAHKIAEACIKKGVDPDAMYSRLFHHLTMAQLRIFSKALQSMELYLDDKVIIQVITLEECRAIGVDAMELEHLDLEYLLEFDKSIGDVECVALLREVGEDKVRVSLRATADLNLSSVIQEIGGGGHSKAAGALVHGRLSEVKTRILEGLESLLKSRSQELGVRS